MFSILLQYGTSQMVHVYSTLAVWITGGLTALSMLTAPCPPPGLIQRVIAVDERVYARAFIPYASDSLVDSYSEDGGQTWQLLDVVPASIAQELEQKVELPKIVCDPSNLERCYRITGQGQVEESIDGSSNWHVAWSLPEERRSYMERVAFCGKSIDLGPYDMVLINQDETHTLIVALGSEGVLVRTPAGDWQRYTVVPGYSIGPTPYVAGNTSTAISVTGTERLYWLLAGLFTLMYLWFRSVNTILKRMNNQLKPERSNSWVTGPVVLLGVALLSLCILIIGILSYRISVYAIYLLAWLVILFPLLSYILTWQRVARIAYQPGQAWLAAGICMLTGLAIFPLAWLPFPLWALGIISRYEFAQVLSVLMTALIWWWGFRQAGRVSARASTPSNSPGT